MKTKLLGLALVFTLVIGLVGIGYPGEAKRNVIVITGGSRTDGAWSESHFKAYQNIKEKFPQVEATFVDMVDYPDHVAVLSAAAAKNDLIMTDTTLYEALMKVAAENPKTWFAFGCPTKEDFERDFPFDNVVGYEMRDEDAGFLAGVAGSMITKTNKLGFIGGQAYPEIIRYGYGYKLGMEYVNPEAKLLVLYTGSWVDIEKAYDATKAVIAQGGDVIAHYSDAGGFGVAKAVKEKAGVYFIGEVLDQNSLAPERTITSFLVHHTKFFEHAVRTLLDGTIHREHYSFGIKPGRFTIEQENWPVVAPLRNVPDKVKEKVEEVKELIRTGKLEVPLVTEEEKLRPLY